MTFHDKTAPSAAEPAAQPVLRLTHGEWRRLLEDRSFLDDANNRYQHPRRYRGQLVEIVPAPSWRG